MQELNPRYIDDFTRLGVVWQNIQTVESSQMFDMQGWSAIFPDLSNNADVDRFLSEGYGQCLVAHTLSSERPFAFTFIYCEDKKERKLSFHGGGWIRGNSMLNYAAAVSLMEELFHSGYKIRSSCLIGNTTTYRFLKSIGFVNHYTSKHYHHFWLPYKRFINSEIYRRLHN